MSVRRAVIEKAFGGYEDPLSKCIKGAGVPSSNAKRIGIIYYDTTNDNCYIATDTSGTWVKINA